MTIFFLYLAWERSILKKSPTFLINFWHFHFVLAVWCFRAVISRWHASRISCTHWELLKYTVSQTSFKRSKSFGPICSLMRGTSLIQTSSSKIKINTYKAIRQHVIVDVLQGNTDTGAVVSFANLTFTERVQPAVFFLVPLSPDGIFSSAVSPSDSLAVLTYSTGSVYAAWGGGVQLQPPSFEATTPDASPATAHSSAASTSSS